jgi:diguanylate cyclase (GGDEF)-like protein
MGKTKHRRTVMSSMMSSKQNSVVSKKVEKEPPSHINSIALFPVSEKRFLLLSNKPGWLDLLGQSVNTQHIVLKKPDSFLESFLAAAKVFWSSNRKGILRSGTWVQTDAQGIEYTFEATASNLINQPVLIVQQITESYLEIGRILQSTSGGSSSEDQMEMLAFRDDLTGFYNGRGFLVKAEESLLAARSKQQPVTMACIGLDLENSANDKDDQRINNQLISYTTILFKKVFRNDDILGRFGEGNFFAMLSNMDYAQAELLSSRLNKAIDSWNEQHETQIQISFKIGLVCDDGSVQPLDQMVNQMINQAEVNKANSTPMCNSSNRTALCDGIEKNTAFGVP